MDRILIVEADDTLAELVREWLEADGYAVVRGTLAEGVYVRATDDAPAAIVVDLAIPPEGWPDLVASLRSAHPGAVIIATSAQFPAGADGSTTLGASLGVRDVIAKPMRRDRVIDALRALLGPGRRAARGRSERG